MANIVANSTMKKSSLVSPNMSSPSTKKPRVKFNEKEIAVDMEERGKLYGTMKIDQIETPFIYYDVDDDPMVAQYKPNEKPQKMEAKALQEALGILLEQKKGNCGGVPVENIIEDGEKWKQADKRMEFIASRNQLYNNEASVLKNPRIASNINKSDKSNSPQASPQEQQQDKSEPVTNLDLPNGWLAFHSKTYNGDIYYFNPSTGVCTWDIPTSESLI